MSLGGDEALLQPRLGHGEPLGRHWFEQVIHRALLERVDRVLVIRGDEYDMGLVVQLARAVDAVLPRHADVQEDDVRLVLFRQRDRFDAIGRFVDHLQVRPYFGKPGAQLVTHRRFVVNEQGCGHARFSIGPNGTRIDA